MTKDEALTLAREAGFKIIDNMIFVEGWEISPYMQRFAELVFEQGRQEGMKQERALWELSKLGQEIEAQSEQYTDIVANGGLDPRNKFDAQSERPWVGLTNSEVNNFAAGCHLGKSVQAAIYEAEAKLKEKNFD